ncbi:sugar phosphate isomerase/epimerase [Aeoliella sp. ICT_H6.2]|uniref:Sugar phosphate isomerase/epimerase n=1 Tax=Aeoliella straminimaris TaxID=2954799 RepID=A0A9X2JKS2_9BACT|nr:sugar phosphate isomerase/epimerase family protein [Aeoliella straminimaris]MCO6047249.1 sugar phosphate isomerase/epimerase [Aeoliella straminimaris]
MKLAFSSNAYLQYSVEETIRRIASMGYTGIEILADVPHAWPAGLLPEQVESLSAALDEYQLPVSNVNAFMMNAVADPRQPYWHPGWIDPDPHYRAIRREHTKRALGLAAEIGAPHITTEPGGPLAESQTREEAFDIFYEELMPCLELAADLAMPLLIEPEPELLIEKFDEYLEFVDRLDSPQVGLNFDAGHAYCVGEDPQDWVEKMAPHTVHYHLEDIAASRVHQHLIPGRGAIDFRATLAAIAATNYDGWLTVELYPYMDNPDLAAREAMEYLKPLVDEVVGAV